MLVDVVATAVNRADTLQRMGFYPRPRGQLRDHRPRVQRHASRQLGEGVEGWSVGDEVCALLTGGGYAARVAVPVGQLMPVPAGVSLVDAAALPEVACTVWSNVFMVAGLQPGEKLLVHGGAGGIGTMAIQLATALSAKVFATAGSAAKLAVCADLGADVTDQLPRRGLRRGAHRPTAAPTSSSTTWARSTSPATSTPSPTRAAS